MKEFEKSKATPQETEQENSKHGLYKNDRLKNTATKSDKSDGKKKCYGDDEDKENCVRAG